MSAFTAEFVQATKDVRTLRAKPADADLLRLYALYKQATSGDCSEPRPPFYDMKGCAKWAAWRRCVGLSREAAMTEYAVFVGGLLTRYG